MTEHVSFGLHALLESVADQGDSSDPAEDPGQVGAADLGNEHVSADDPDSDDAEQVALHKRPRTSWVDVEGSGLPITLESATEVCGTLPPREL